jgi:hypothetical protein
MLDDFDIAIKAELFEALFHGGRGQDDDAKLLREQIHDAGLKKVPGGPAE